MIRAAALGAAAVAARAHTAATAAAALALAAAYTTTRAAWGDGAATAGQQQQQTPGQAFLASLVDYEKLGVPRAVGVSSSSSSNGSPSTQPARAFDLATMHALLAALGSPHERLPVVHIAGTKGKGSVAVLLSSVLRAAGYRVGTYTSPHLFDMRERVVVGGGGGGPGQQQQQRQAQPDSSSGCAAGEPVSEQQWEALAVQAAAAVDAMAGPQQQPSPSHFEVVTAMALQHFVNEGVQLAVIETGLGGATDATNVWCPGQLQAAVLTAVGLDHVDALGGSLEAIAAAKAGIMKPGVPVVVGPQQLPAPAPAPADTAAAKQPPADGQAQRAADGAAVMAVFREAASRPGMACPLLLATDVVHVHGTDTGSSSSSGSVTLLPGPGAHLARQSVGLAAALDAAAVLHSDPAAADGSPPLQLDLPNVALQLVGAHQASNVATAVAAALVLAARGWRGIDAAAVRRGLEAAWLPGRFQVAQLPDSSTHYVLDGAHTADSAAALAATLQSAFHAAEPVVLVVAMAADKQHREVMEALRAVRPKVVVFTSVPIAGSHARAAPPGTLAAHWQAAAMLSSGRPFRCRELIQANLGAALEKARHELGAYGGRGVVCVTGSLHAVAAASKQLELQYI